VPCHDPCHARGRAPSRERTRAQRPGLPVTAIPADAAGHGPPPGPPLDTARGREARRAGCSGPKADGITRSGSTRTLAVPARPGRDGTGPGPDHRTGCRDRPPAGDDDRPQRTICDQL